MVGSDRWARHRGGLTVEDGPQPQCWVITDEERIAERADELERRRSIPSQERRRARTS
jgi:hypothetical protein